MFIKTSTRFVNLLNISALAIIILQHHNTIIYSNLETQKTRLSII